MFSTLSRLLVTTTLICAGGAGLLPPGGAAAGGAPRGPEPLLPQGGWSAPVTIGISPGPYPSFDVAVAPDGSMTVAYVEDGDVRLAQRPAGGAWGVPTTLVGNGAANDVRAAYDGFGRLVVAWAEAQDRARLVSRHQLEGGGWSSIEVIATRPSYGFWELDLEVNARGDAALGARWLGQRTHPVLVSQRRAGGAWLTPSRFVGERFDVALGASGPVALAWTTWDGETATVLVARRPLVGEWGATRVLAEFFGFVIAPGATTVAVDGLGTTTVVWRDRASDGSWQIRASRAARGHAFGPELVLGTNAGNPDLAYSPPKVLANDSGLTVALWMRLNGTIRAVRRPVGGTWSAAVKVKPERVVSPFDAALDPSGRSVAVWIRGGWFGEAGRGVVASLMNRRGQWSVPANITARQERVYDPAVAMNHGAALSAWTQVVDNIERHYRASTHRSP